MGRGADGSAESAAPAPLEPLSGHTGPRRYEARCIGEPFVIDIKVQFCRRLASGAREAAGGTASLLSLSRPASVMCL